MVFHIISDPQGPAPAHLRLARGRVERHLPVLDQAMLAHAFVSLLSPVRPVPPRFLGRPRLLTYA
jgi:hypothetical protein